MLKEKKTTQDFKSISLDKKTKVQIIYIQIYLTTTNAS